MDQGRADVRVRLRVAAVLVDVAIHIVAFLLVLGEVLDRLGTDAAVAAGLLFPVTYLVGPLVLGVVDGEWLAFALQMVAIVGAVGLVGVPMLDREQPDSRLGCLQVATTTLLVVIVDLALHAAALAVVIDHVNRDWGTEAAIVAALLFPVTYLAGPVALAFIGADGLPLLLQLAAFGLIGLLLVLSDA